MMNPPEPPLSHTEKPTQDDDIEKNRDIAAISYAWIMAVFVWFSKRDSPFVRFHTRQALVLFAFSLIFWLIPFAGKFLELLVLGGCIYGFAGAAQGQRKEIPLIGSLARGDVTALWTEIRKFCAAALHFRRPPSTPQPSPPPPHEKI